MRLDWIHGWLPVLYLMQRSGSIIVAESWVSSVLQEQSDNIGVPTVSSTMQWRRPTWSLGGRTSADLQKKGAHAEVTAPAGIVLRPRDKQG